MSLSLLEIITLLVQFIGISLLIYALFSYPFKHEPPANRRIAMAMGAYNRNTIYEVAPLKPIMVLMLAAGSRCPIMRGQIKDYLEASGNPQNYSVEEYMGISVLSGITGAGILILLSAAMWGVGPILMIMMIMGIIFGFIVPVVALRATATARQLRIIKQLPYTLDLIALLMQAGATFNEAVVTLIADNPEDDLNQELSLLLTEIDYGTQRATALKNMAERTHIETMISVVGAINQAEALGTPLSDILKSQSEMLRNQRSVRAEELSAKASTKILIPTLLILFAVLLMIAAPFVIRWYEEGGIF